MNWRNAPAYKLAKFLVNILKSYASFPYAVNVKNMKQLLLDIQQIPFDGELKFSSFSITNIYTNVPNKKARELIHGIFKNDVDQRIKKEILDICDVIIQQKYFYFSKKCYIQKDGLAMVAPMSSILSEYYIQHIKHTLFPPILRKFRILGYFRYVDDILIIYNGKATNIESKISLPHMICIFPSMFQISAETCSWLTYYFYKVVFDGC